MWREDTELEIVVGKICFEVNAVIQARGDVDWTMMIGWNMEKNKENRNIF